MKGGRGLIGNRIRTKNQSRSNHLREKCESDRADSDSEPHLFSDIWPLTISDGDADHHLEAGSDSVEGRRIVNISYLASHIIRKQLNVLVVEKVASASIVSKLSQSDIGLAHLELALKRDSVNGIKLLLKEPNGALKYRITNNNMAIAKITSYIQKR